MDVGSTVVACVGAVVVSADDSACALGAEGATLVAAPGSAVSGAAFCSALIGVAVAVDGGAVCVDSNVGGVCVAFVSASLGVAAAARLNAKQSAYPRDHPRDRSRYHALSV